MLTKRSSTDQLLLIIILITGCLLRFYNFSTWSLSNDELSALSRLQFPSFSSVIENGVKLDDMHPPGVQTFLYFLTKWFGNSVFIVRLPFVLAGIFSIYIFYLLAASWINKKGALIATALFSSLIFPVLYSQLARPYSFGLLFVLINVLFLSRLLYPENNDTNSTINKKHLLIYILSGALCMYTHYFAFLMAGIIGIAGVIMAKSSLKLWLVGAGVGMFVLYIPAIPVFMYQMGIGGLGGEGGWLGPPEKDAILQLLYFIFNESNIVSIMVLLILLYGLMHHFKNPVKNNFRFLSILFFLIPFIIAFFYSLYKNPVYQHSIMLFNFPFLLIFICSFIPSEDHKIYRYVTPVILLITVSSTIAEKRFYNTNYFGVFKELVLHADTTARKYGNDNVTFTSNVIKPYYINYYHDQFDIPVRYDLFSCNTTPGLAALDSIVKSAATTYLSYSWSNTLNRDETDLIIRNSYPYLVSKENYFNSGYRLYSKKKTDGQPKTTVFQTELNFEGSSQENDNRMLTNDIAHSGKQSIHFTSTDEFGPTFRKSAEELHFSKGDIIAFSAWVFTNEPVDGNLVLQMNDNDKTLFWSGSPAKDYVTQTGKWKQIYVVHTLTEDFNKSCAVSAYYWNSGKRNLYIDDFRIEVIQQ